MQWKRIFSGVLAAAMLVGTLPSALAAWEAPTKTWEPVSREDVKTRLFVGSDIHIGRSDDASKKFENALKAFNDIDDEGTSENTAQVFVGDVTNNGAVAEYDKLMSIEEANTNDTERQTIWCMGNHEFNTGDVARFEDKTQQDNNYVAKVGGITVITLGAVNYGGDYSSDYDFLKAALETAVDEDPNAPIFVMAHHGVKDTAYVTNEWNGNYGQKMLDLMKQYPQIIHISGHSHSTMEDNRSIDQSAGFTAIQDGTIGAYFENESGKYDPNTGKLSTYPANSEVSSQALTIDVSDDNVVTIRRMNLTTGEYMYEDEPWVINTPELVEDFATNATYGKVRESTAPSFTEGAAVTTSGLDKTSVKVSFPAATPASGKNDDMIHTYKVTLTPKSGDPVVREYWNDYYEIPANMKKDWIVQVKDLAPNTTYSVKVEAVTSYDVASQPITAAENITTGADYVAPYPAEPILDVDFSRDATGADAKNHTQEVYGAPQFVTDPTLKRTVASFDGVDDGLRYDMSSADYEKLSKNFTVELYYKPKDTKNNNPMGNTQSSGFCFEQKSGTNTLQFWAHIGGSYKKPEVNVVKDEWNHVVGTFDGQNVKMYLNGELKSIVAATGTLTEPPHYLFLGGDTTSGGALEYQANCEIALARVYTGTMTADDVKAAYEAASRVTTEPDESGAMTQAKVDAANEAYNDDAAAVEIISMSDPHIASYDSKKWAFQNIADWSDRIGFNTDAVMVDGDVEANERNEFTDSSKYFYNAVIQLFGETFNNNVHVLYAYGNHDVKDVMISMLDAAKVDHPNWHFERNSGQNCNYHVKVNGFDFITLDYSSGNDFLSKANYLTKTLAEISSAPDYDAKKPIFIQIHSGLNGTTWGSNQDITKIDMQDALANYPQAIVMTAHSHYSNEAESGIWQGNFTVVNNGSMDYVELPASIEPVLPAAQGKLNEDGQREHLELTCNYISVLEDGTTVIRRFDVTNQRWMGMPWIIETQKGKDSFRYTSDKRSKIAPWFEENAEFNASNVTDDTATIQFTQAVDDELVQEYQVMLKTGDKNASYSVKADNTTDPAKNITGAFTTYSRFYLRPYPETMTLYLGDLAKGTEYTVQVTAKDNFGNASETKEFTFKTTGEAEVPDTTPGTLPDGVWDGLQVDMRFNDNLTDETANANAVTSSNIAYENGVREGHAVRVKANQKIDLGAIAGLDNLGTTGNATYSFWYKPYKTVADKVIFGNKSWSSATNAGIVFAYPWNNSDATLMSGSIGSGDGNYGNTKYLDFQGMDGSDWNLLTVSVDRTAGTITTYVNGKQCQSSELPEKATLTSGSHYYIGGESLDFAMDNLRIWNRALSGEEITALYRVDLYGEAVAPTITFDTPPGETCELNEKFTTPKVTITEGNSEIVKKTITIRHPNGKNEVIDNVLMVNKFLNGYAVKMDEAGTWTFTYTAADKNGQTAEKSFDVKVNSGGTNNGGSSGGSGSSTTKPSLSVGAGGSASLSKDNKVVTITPDAGYEIADVTVNGVSKGAVSTVTVKSGDKVVVTFQKIEETGKHPFTDLIGHWAENDVMKAVEKGLFQGTSETTFSPNRTLTRGMLVTVLYRMDGSDAVNSPSGFPDVASDAYYADAVAWAAQKGIVLGMEDGAFRPNNPITRQQLAAVLYRYAGSPAGTGDLTSFPDGGSVAGYAADAVRWAVGSGIIQGSDTGLLNPSGSATRAQSAVMLLRFMDQAGR